MGRLVGGLRVSLCLFVPFLRFRRILFVALGLLTDVLIGVLLGIYATSNGGNGTTPAYFSDWKYNPIEQFRD